MCLFMAGEIPTANITTELKALYNTLNNPNRGRGRGKKSDEAATWGGTTPRAPTFALVVDKPVRAVTTLSRICFLK